MSIRARLRRLEQRVEARQQEEKLPEWARLGLVDNT